MVQPRTLARHSGKRRPGKDACGFFCGETALLACGCDIELLKSSSEVVNCNCRSRTISIVVPFASTASGPRVSNKIGRAHV